MAVSLSAPILILDDYNTMIRIIRNLLRQLGFTHIDEASDARSALTKLRERDYQLIISDWDLAPVGGAEMVERLREIERCRQTPVLVVANAPDEEAEAERAGVGGYLVKPFGAQTLRERLERLLGGF